MTRREFLHVAVSGVASFALPEARRTGMPTQTKPLRFGVITDVHHGLAPDAEWRLAAFLREVNRRGNLDLVLQLGDFCHVDPAAGTFLDQWRNAPCPRLDVLGNHDMDRYSKEETMRAWGMPSRFGSQVLAGYRWIWLDLNHFWKDGSLVAYEKGNYFTDNARHNYADPEQLEWLRSELKTAKEPTILLAHQPLGVPDANGSLPPEQQEIAEVLMDAKIVRLCLSGHLHVDRLGAVGGIPALSVNSSSYFWYRGMNPYTRPLFAFMEIYGDTLRVSGRQGEFEKPPPEESASVEGRSASIIDRKIDLGQSRTYVRNPSHFRMR